MIADAARRAGVPEDLIDGLELYVEHGIPPGHFLLAVLTNDLFAAMARADDTSRAGLFALCTFVWNDLPAASWGLTDRVADWIERRRNHD